MSDNSLFWVVWLGLKIGQTTKFIKLKKWDHFSNQLIEPILKMPKFFRKVHFLKKIALENLHGFAGRQIFFAQKVAFNVCMVGYKFTKNCSIRLKNSFLAFKGHFLPYPELPFNAQKTKKEPWGMTFQKRCVTLVNLTYINAFSSIENFLIFAYF